MEKGRGCMGKSARETKRGKFEEIGVGRSFFEEIITIMMKEKVKGI